MLKKHNKKGITLVALIITIVIMLILAGVTIGAINGGLFEYAGKAKISTEESSKKEGIKESFILAESKSKTGKVTRDDMQNALNKIFEKDYAEVIDNEGGITVRIEDKYYDLDSNGNPGDGKIIKTIPNAGDITKTGAGTEDDPYQIRCIEDLVGLSRRVNSGTTAAYLLIDKYIVLTKDLDFNSIYSYSNYQAKYKFDSSINSYVADKTSETTIKELCTTGLGFIPITNLGAASSSAFRGTFDGKEHTISNIYINSTNNTNHKGLFGKVYSGTIKNLTIDGLIKGKVTGGGGIGGIVGGASGNSYITNCVNKAKVEGSESIAGGITGVGGNIEKCHNEGMISGVVSGGICGSNGGTIKKCWNMGNVVCYGSQASGGGASGIGNASTIVNCYNIGKIGDNNTGAADGIGRPVKNCYNAGEITANPKKKAQYGGPGGITGGGASGSTQYNCCSYGMLHQIGVNGSSYRGGVISYGGSMKNCYYLNGIHTDTKITPETDAIVFYKTSDNPEAMTAEKVKDALNNYIELKGVLNEGDTEVNTTGWCKWVIGDDNLPILDFNTEWNGTEWVEVKN